MTPVWTITYNGVEQSCAAWGLTAAPIIKTKDRSPTEVSFRLAGAALENGVPFPFRSQVTLRQNRVLSGGTWSTQGSGWTFVGYQTTQPGDVNGHKQGITLVFKDALWLLQHTVFMQQWNIASTPGTPYLASRVVLFMDINSWVPNVYQSVQWQLTQIINYAASCGIAIQAGTIDYSGWFLNYYHARAISCWDAILKCLEPIVDAKVWVDGTTTPPSLHIRTRASLTAMSTPTGTGPGPIRLPYKGTDALGRQHFSSKSFTPRYDLQPNQVVLQYQINNTYNGKPSPTWTSDVYPPASTGQSPFAMVCPIDLLGASKVTETGTLDCEPLACVGGTHAQKRAWWAGKRGGETDKLTDFRVRFGANTLADATVVDDSGNPINLTSYPNRLVKGTYHAWMSSGSNPVYAIRAHIRVKAQFTEYDTVGSGETDTSGNLIKQSGSHELHAHVTLINAPSGSTLFTNSSYTSLAETPVAGLAQNIFQSRSMLDYDGTHEIVDSGIKNGVGQTQPLTQIIGHWNVLNFSGGNNIWANANMTVAATEINMLTNHLTITVGPSKHLQPQDWSSMLQFFRYRRLYMESSVRATGQADGAANVDMPLNTPDANTVPGLDVAQVQALLAPDAVATGLTNLITHDATTGQATRVQQYGGAAVATGYITPEYLGTGPPSLGSLGTNTYYRVSDKYVDVSVTPNIPYRCTSAGTGNVGGAGGSVWAQVGSNGTGWNYRGVWVSTSTYMTNDVALLGPGTSAGLYLCLMDNNTSQPDSSIGWVELSSFSTWL